MKSVVAMRSGNQEVRGLSTRTLALAFVLGVMVLWSCGCAAYPGETAAEANRRRKRVVRVNSQAMLADVDTVLMLDRPSHLTDKRLP